MGESVNDPMAHLTTGALVVYGLEWLKAAEWCPWVSVDRKWLNRVISAVAAAAIAFGISAQGDMSAGWVITIPPVTVLAAGGWEWLKQIAIQQLVFDGIVSKGGQV